MSLDPAPHVLEWLLEPVNPSVRYFTLRQLLDKPADDPEVQQAHAAIQKSPIVKTIFRHQNADGGWSSEKALSYEQWGKQATVYTLLMLGELGVTPKPACQRALDLLANQYQLTSGLIDVKRIKSQRRRNSPATQGWCLTALTLRAALALGYPDHVLVDRAISFFEINYEEKGGWACSVYTADPTKVRPPNCYMGTIKVLQAFHLLPVDRQTRRLKQIIKGEVATCLTNHVYLYRVGKDGAPVAKRSWKKFAFPRFWKSDALEAADVLTQMGIKDKRLAEVKALIQGKQQPDGRWLLDHSATKDAWVELEPQGEPSKWITLRALRVLQRLSRL